MKCKHCGAEIANDSVYCEFCGKFTNPANKKGVTCEANLVKWLLYSVMFVLCASNLLVGIYFDDTPEYPDRIYFLWWIIPFLSLIICVISLVLTIKKKIAGIFTVVMFLLFGANTTEMAVGMSCIWEERYTTFAVGVQEYDEYTTYSYVLKPVRWAYGAPHHSSYDECMHHIDVMQVPTELSGNGCVFRLYPDDEHEMHYGDTQLTIAIVSIIEGAILLIYLISYAIYAPIAARKRRQLQ